EEVVTEQIRTTLREFPGVAYAITPFLGERIEEVLSGARGEVVVNLFGNDLGVLDHKAEEVRRIVAGTRGAVDVFLQSQSGSPELAITLRPDRLRQFGFQPVSVLEAVHTAYQGTTVAQTYENERVFEVSVILDPAKRRDVDAVGALLVRNSEGLQLPLRELADIDFTSGRHVIEHEGTLRLRQVTCDVEDRD